MLPIRLQQLPRFLRQTAERSRLLRQPLARQPLFRLCYFSCQSYFRYLYCALHSLQAVAGGLRIEVLVFSDTDQPLSAAQIEILRDLVPGIRVIPWPKSMGWGAVQIGHIWRAYALAVEGLEDGDVVARIDSDVFFFNDAIFRAVERSDAALVGDGHYVRFEFCQGGCYFFRASAVRSITSMLQRDGMDQILREVDVVVEDVAATHFARRLGLKVWMTWIMMFPDELRNAGGLTRWARWKFSCAHFVMKNKAYMLESYERDMFHGRVPEKYARQLETA